MTAFSNPTLLAAAALAMLAGSIVISQPAFNAQLAQNLGSTLGAVFVNFVVGATCSGLLLLATRTPWPSLGAIAATPKHLWVVGGLLGTLFVVSATWAAPRVGVALYMGILVSAQLTSAMVLDHFGVAGLSERPITLARLAGVGLLIAGALLVTRG